MKRLNIILFCINSVFLLMFLFLWFLPAYRRFASDSEAIAKAGMYGYVKCKPFTIYVDNKFPHNKSCLLTTDSFPMQFQCTDVGRGRMMASINLPIGGGSVGVLFAYTNGTQMQKIVMNHGDAWFIDTGAKGFYETNWVTTIKHAD